MEKIILNIFTNRLRPVSEEADGQKRCDFTADASFIDQITTLGNWWEGSNKSGLKLLEETNRLEWIQYRGCAYMEFQVTIIIKGECWDSCSAVRNVKQLAKSKFDLGAGDMESHSFSILKMNVAVRCLGGHNFERSVAKVFCKYEWYVITGK